MPVALLHHPWATMMNGISSRDTWLVAPGRGSNKALYYPARASSQMTADVCLQYSPPTGAMNSMNLVLTANGTDARSGVAVGLYDSFTTFVTSNFKMAVYAGEVMTVDAFLQQYRLDLETDHETWLQNSRKERRAARTWVQALWNLFRVGNGPDASVSMLFHPFRTGRKLKTAVVFEVISPLEPSATTMTVQPLAATSTLDDGL